MKGRNIDKHGLAINILKFQCFNFEFFNCQEIVLFETLMVLGGISFTGREEFFHSTQTLVDNTGVKRHSVDRILMKFKKIGIIDYEIKGMPKVKHIKILWDNILEMLPEIYQFDKVKEYYGGSTQPLIDFYKLLAENDKKITENTKEKNTIKNSTEEYEEEYEKEFIVNAKAGDTDAIKIRKLKDFINDLEYYGSGKEFNENDLIQAVKFYDLDLIMEMIHFNAENDPFFNLKKLLRLTKKNKITAIGRFLDDKKHQTEILCESFQRTLSGRIINYNTDNKDWKNQHTIKFKEEHKVRIWKATKSINEEEILNAFTAFCDDILYGRVPIKKDILNYFLKLEDEEFPVIEKYSLKYLGNYSNFK